MKIVYILKLAFVTNLTKFIWNLTSSVKAGQQIFSQ